MNHIKAIIGQQGNVALEAQQEIAMEGLVSDAVDKIKSIFGKFKNAFSRKPDEFLDQLEDNIKAGERNKKILVKLKQVLSSSKADITKDMDLGPHLRKLGIKATTAKEVIAKVKRRAYEHDVVWNQICDLCKEASRLDMESPQTAKDHIKLKIKALEAKLKIEPLPESDVRVTFHRPEMIEVTQALIDMLDSFIDAAKEARELKFYGHMLSMEAYQQDGREEENPGPLNTLMRDLMDLICSCFQLIAMFVLLYILVVILFSAPVLAILGMFAVMMLMSAASSVV